MSQGSKKEFYHYSARTACLTSFDMCTDKVYAYILPPENSQSIENLHCHFKMTFDAGIASADRVLEGIGIASGVPATVEQDPDYVRMVTLNQAADGSGVIEVSLDLSHLLKKDNIATESDITADFNQNNMTMVFVRLDAKLREEATVGVIDLWKVDAIFTTEAIR